MSGTWVQDNLRAPSSSGSCAKYPILIPSCGFAVPSNSVSTPAMMRRSVDLPAPFSPTSPILAPG
eukprot:scaffold172908_cov33-Tisochrysis_lutea.AAC.3